LCGSKCHPRRRRGTTRKRHTGGRPRARHSPAEGEMLQTILDAWRAVHRLALGPPKSPHAARTRESLLLVAFLAGVGLGADGLSSANYGPEAAYLALGEHSGLSLYIAIATAVTVFVIGLGY